MCFLPPEPTLESVMKFGSPYSKERQEFIEAAQEWFSTRNGPLPRAKPDILEPFITAFRGVKKKQISIRVDGWMIELTKLMAKQHQMPYQKIFQIWMADGLRRAVKEGIESLQNTQEDSHGTHEKTSSEMQ